MQFVIISLSLSIISILLGFIYSYIILYTDWLKGRSIQDKNYRPDHFRQRAPLILFNISLLMIIMGFGLYFGYNYGIFDETTPSIGLFVFQVVVLLLCDDFYFYVYHRTLHEIPFLYRKIHRIHHQATAPFPLEFIYVHPLEWMLGAIGILLGIIVLQEVNIYAFWAYVLFRNLHELDIHSGTKSMFGQYLPFYGTVEHHDQHHSKVNGNYASSLTIWDKLFKTKV